METITLQLKNNQKNTPYLRSEHDGQDLINEFEDYIKELKEDLQERQENEENENTPLAQKDPETVLIDFIVWLLGDQEYIEDNYSITNTKEKNNYTYNLQKDEWEHPKDK